MRRTAGDRDVPAHSVEELVTQLAGGSVVAHRHLEALARSGHGSVVVDHLAASAASDCPHALELLLALIVEHDLTGPALHRLTSDPTISQDIGQEVLVAVARSIHRFRGGSRFTTWLYAVTRNVAITHLRRLRPAGPLVDDAALGDPRLRRMSSLVTERRVVHQAIDSLPSPFRDTVVLRDIEGLSYAEIAAQHGVEINTVRSRLSRGRALLAARLP